MKRRIAEFIAQTAEENGMEVSVRNDYSGRGMYGQQTSALTVDSMGDLLAAVALAGAAATQGDIESNDGPLLEDLAEAAQNLRTDNMGRGIVVY